jgi:hypothetical protein
MPLVRSIKTPLNAKTRRRRGKREPRKPRERFTLSASIPFSASDGEKVAKPDEVRRTNQSSSAEGEVRQFFLLHSAFNLDLPG